MSRHLSRRRFVQSSAAAAAAVAGRNLWGAKAPAEPADAGNFLAQFDYGDVSLASDLHENQLHETHAVLMELSDDSLLKPLRQMAGMPAPGEDLGGWYHFDPDLSRFPGDNGFAPACTFGQWVSALARMYAITGDEATRDKVLRLNRLYAQTISPDFYIKNRFPAYCYDKFVIGLLDSHTYAHDPDAFAILERTTDTAIPCLPPHAVEHGVAWRTDHHDPSWTWDESYTMPENLFLAYRLGAGPRYRDLAFRYLDDEKWFDPLSRGENVLAGRHAYSHVNSLSSAMMAWMVGGSARHLRAATNGFHFVDQQSFATGGWGPDEELRAAGSDDLFTSLTKTHASFETPCGSYAHFKITRYLLRVTRDSRYGDSMERMMYNTVLGSKPLQDDGEAFYYSDYTFNGKRVYHRGRWPCCSGTLPQVAADYRIQAYFHDDRDLFVNLYIPSTVRWAHDGGMFSLSQMSFWPYEAQISFVVNTAAPTETTLHFRVPQWTHGAVLAVNGRRWTGPVEPGTFAAVRCTWQDGDRVELEMPLPMRLEPIDAKHPNVVAVMRGPLALFALKPQQDAPMPSFDRGALLAMRQKSEREWIAAAGDSPSVMRFVPFTEVGAEAYTTYLQTT
ncbi:MAG: beta-L-arabinofuranosidase domain-containing protein [Acidobacteriaceae bacterium]